MARTWLYLLTYNWNLLTTHLLTYWLDTAWFRSLVTTRLWFLTRRLGFLTIRLGFLTIRLGFLTTRLGFLTAWFRFQTALDTAWFRS